MRVHNQEKEWVVSVVQTQSYGSLNERFTTQFHAVAKVKDLLSLTGFQLKPPMLDRDGEIRFYLFLLDNRPTSILEM